MIGIENTLENRLLLSSRLIKNRIKSQFFNIYTAFNQFFLHKYNEIGRLSLWLSEALSLITYVSFFLS